jgi:hypothetical protein
MFSPGVQYPAQQNPFVHCWMVLTATMNMSLCTVHKATLAYDARSVERYAPAKLFQTYPLQAVSMSFWYISGVRSCGGMVGL